MLNFLQEIEQKGPHGEMWEAHKISFPMSLLKTHLKESSELLKVLVGKFEITAIKNLSHKKLPW